MKNDRKGKKKSRKNGKLRAGEVRVSEVTAVLVLVSVAHGR